MKTKHKKGEAKKQMYQTEEIHLTQRERRKTRNDAADNKLISLKTSVKASDKSRKTPNEKTIVPKEEQYYYSNTKFNKPILLTGRSSKSYIGNINLIHLKKARLNYALILT